ncbi:MAG TPA: 30S ribosomal protein S12 methylthiotransferase RimO [Anaerolineaceae bacterium]|nr:30S ribosomal protein S12 methylthiotransferase RimO [Anaerolineaceae bacterium]
MIKKNTYYLVSLGCAKNSVDSESIATLLNRDGYLAVDKPSRAGVLIVNTCGFIQQARHESVEVLNELAKGKKPGQLLVAAGCFSQLYREKLVELVPGIDGLIGTRRWMDVAELVRELRANPGVPRYHLPDTPTIGRDEKGVARVSLQGASAYLKIADGCRRPCAFCSIPLIKGTQVSRPMEVILDEAALLQDHGIKELILIAQDTTDYGSDLGVKDGLVRLLEKLLPRVPAIPWVRILYAYPGYVTNGLIDLMSSSPQLLPYLDVPLQHASVKVLKAMKRPANMDWVRGTIEKMRARIPGLALRTTFISGYPGESDADHQELLDFIRQTAFDHLGVFPFSFESGTASAPLGDTIPEEVKLQRVEEIMRLQEGISLQENQRFVGRTLDVLVEGRGDGITVGRSYRDAPEIDGLVIVEGEKTVGEIVPVTITGALTHDLTGHAADS